MPDQRFYTTEAALSIGDIVGIARSIDKTARQTGQGGAVARVAAPDEEALENAVVFCQEKSAAEQLAQRSFGLALARPLFADMLKSSGPLIICDAPRRIFADIARRLHRPRGDAEGQAALIGAGVSKHETAVIGARAEIGEGCTIGPCAVIGPGVRLGPGSSVGAGASIHFALVGARAQILAGARIGEAGFGFADERPVPVWLPQLGRVVLGDDVEIGANSTVDRGALRDTMIGSGTKIDNLVHVGHNVRIGRNCFIAGQVGFAGSCVIGDGVMIGGQTGFADHVVVGDGARIAAQSGLMRDVPAGESWGGAPAAPSRVWLRATAAMMRAGERKDKKK